jgi:hypothetical protein
MSGIYTKDQLLAIWVSATDKSYNEPFIRKGEGNGLEAYTQGFAQYERVSRAIDNTFQSMFISSWSGQTAPSASGEKRARVSLKVNREKLFELPVVVPVELMVEEIATDHSADGAVEVRTGRKYAITASVAWLPGESQEQSVGAVATVPGWGHNNPDVNSIRGIVQYGKTLIGAAATVESMFPREVLTAEAGGDSFYTPHIGQYVRFTAGWNAGKVRKIGEYKGSSTVDAGKVALDAIMVFYGSFSAGQFAIGEEVMDSVTGALGDVLAINGTATTLMIRRKEGVYGLSGALITPSATFNFTSVDMTGMCYALGIGTITGPMDEIGHETVDQAVTGATGFLAAIVGSYAFIYPTGNVAFDGTNLIAGWTSGELIFPVSVGVDPMLVNETTQTASWEILSWDDDLGIAFHNEASPTLGRSGTLDELGMERKIPRVSGENDAQYSERISKLADVVSPRAIARAATRILQPLGVSPCIREVGQLGFRGFYYDVPTNYAPKYAFAWDMDFSVRPQDAWKLLLSYADFRAFMAIGVPPTGIGEFGFAYDDHPLGFFDSTPYLTFFDGYPVTTSNVLKSLWNDINQRKAGGVGFVIYSESDGCVHE